MQTPYHFLRECKDQGVGDEVHACGCDIQDLDVQAGTRKYERAPFLLYRPAGEYFQEDADHVEDGIRPDECMCYPECFRPFTCGHKDSQELEQDGQFEEQDRGVVHNGADIEVLYIISKSCRLRFSGVENLRRGIWRHSLRACPTDE